MGMDWAIQPQSVVGGDGGMSFSGVLCNKFCASSIVTTPLGVRDAHGIEKPGESTTCFQPPTMAGPASRTLPDVPDILYYVFSYLDPVHESQYDQLYESRRTLAMAARTCRGFSGPALDVLWRRLPDDQPLADLLCVVEIASKENWDREDPELLGKDKPSRYRLPNQGGPGYRSPRAVAAYDRRWRLSRGYDTPYFLRATSDARNHPGWPRFEEYASRVRAITLFAFDGPAWGRIWGELRSCIDGAPILPNLLSVAFCRISTQALNPDAFVLISPSVRKLNLNIDPYGGHILDEKLRCLFSRSFDCSPEIDNLRLELPPSRLGPSLLRTHCSHIHHLEVFPQIDLDELQLLTELPALQHLAISLPRQTIHDASPPFTLPSVSTLVVGGTWTNLSTFLDTVRLPSLHTLSLTGWAYGDPAASLAQGATQCFRTIAESATSTGKHSSLISLSISASDGRLPPQRGCVVYSVPRVKDTVEVSFMDLVHPLLSLSALRDLSLALPSYFNLACTAADLRAVAESFAALEAFHLSVPHYRSRYYGVRPGVPPEREGEGELELELERPRGGPLDALVHFARNCPRLRVLHLPPMEIAEGTLAVLVAHEHEHGRNSGPRHGLWALVIPKVLLPPGRADLAGRVSTSIRGVFNPRVASPFRPERLVVQGDWAVADGASRCPECMY
ncbi:hypothetical protein V8D89_015679 [Ganoderma adspersum]